jgi:hypothetical protein
MMASQQKARKLVVGRDSSLPFWKEKHKGLMQISEHAHTPDVRRASCVVVSFTLDLISWFRAEHAVCEPCHLTWSIHLSGEANESFERWFGVSISS